MGGYGHHSARTIARQDVVTDPDGYSRTRQRVASIGASEDTRDAAIGHAIALGTTARGGEVLLDSRCLLRGGHLGDVVTLGSKHHEGHAIDRIDTRGEDRQGSLLLGALGRS